MERYYKRKNIIEPELVPPIQAQENYDAQGHNMDEISCEVDINNLPSDPTLRKSINSYHHNIRDEVRRAYLQKGPCQPRFHNFKQTIQGNKLRRFNPSWFDDYPTWLEYSVEKEATYCLCCYLFKSDSREHGGSGDAFVVEGFSNWKKKEKLQMHVGGPSSTHNRAAKNCDVLMNQRQHLQTIIHKQSKQARGDYRIRLNASVDCARLLLSQGLAFRGHDESDDSSNPGNFKDILKLICHYNEEVERVAIHKCPGNHKLTSSDIQKDIVHACAIETVNNVIQDLGNAFFSILVDEAHDVSTKEQMAIVIRYVNNKGQVIERLLDIVHVEDTSALSLKASIDATFSKYNLSISRLRGQGCDGASNMQGQFNGLKALVLLENENAFYVHCFAYRLQLALVAIAKDDVSIAFLFSVASHVVNIVGGSCKRHDMLLKCQAFKVFEAIESGELESGRGKNQKGTIKRAGETRWGSHYYTLISLIKMFSAIGDVLDFIIDNGKSDQKLEARTLSASLHSFEFVFCLHLMRSILGITNELSQALQRKDQDIINAMALVRIAKQRLQLMRDNEWNSLLDEVSLFCNEHKISVLDMDDVYIPPGRPRRHIVEVTNFTHYKFELFIEILDLLLRELNDRFNESNTQLLLYFACLNPVDSFFAFEKEKLLHVAQLYPKDFSSIQLIGLENQLETYIMDMRSSCDFLNVQGISQLAERMVKSRKDILYPLVYKLITLALILPVATATVERAFSAMKLVKNRLRNKMGDQWMHDCLITFVEKDIFNALDNEVIMLRYQGMKNRREQL